MTLVCVDLPSTVDADAVQPRRVCRSWSARRHATRLSRRYRDTIMRLTVGPLPAAVYWRRRAVVLAGMVLVIAVIWYVFSGGTAPAGAGSTGATRSPGASSQPTPTGTVLRPIIGNSPTPSATAFSLPTTGETGPCTDDEMQVTASAASEQVVYGTPVPLTIRFRNISARSCQRDIGADVQELRILSGETVVWSSDDCSNNRGHNMSTFAANQEAKFTLTWNGRVSRSGTGAVTCSATAPAPQPGVYQLVGRLGDKLSAPSTLRLT